MFVRLPIFLLKMVGNTHCRFTPADWDFLAGDHLKECFGNDKIEINFITPNFCNVMVSTI